MSTKARTKIVDPTPGKLTNCFARIFSCSLCLWKCGRYLNVTTVPTTSLSKSREPKDPTRSSLGWTKPLLQLAAPALKSLEILPRDSLLPIHALANEKRSRKNRMNLPGGRGFFPFYHAICPSLVGYQPFNVTSPPPRGQNFHPASLPLSRENKEFFSRVSTTSHLSTTGFWSQLTASLKCSE